MSTENNTHTTPTGYEYMYLPSTIDPLSDLADILNEAVKYVDVTIATISPKLFNHLQKAFEIDDHDDIEGSFIYKHKEGNISISKRYTNKNEILFYDLVIFASPNSIEEQFVNDILDDSHSMVKRGLQYLLDPNHGGSMSPRNLEIASLIIYG